MKFKKFAIIVAAPLLVMTAACGVQTGQDVTKLHIGAGPFENPDFKGCIKPGTKDNSPTNDKYIAYPTSGRDYDAGVTKNGDSGPITVVSKDNAEMAIPIRLTWDFTTDCKEIEQFYKLYNRYGANLNDDGSSTEGWTTVMQKVMGATLDTTLDEVAKNYSWRDLYNNAAAQNALQATLSDQIQEKVNEVAKGEFFTDIKVATMQKPYPTNDDLKNAVAAEQAAVATAQSAEAKARATKAQAEAETATAQAEAAKQRAIISGYGNFENYARMQAIQAGLNPYQPTYKVSDTTGQ